MSHKFWAMIILVIIIHENTLKIRIQRMHIASHNIFFLLEKDHMFRLNFKSWLCSQVLFCLKKKKKKGSEKTYAMKNKEYLKI